MLSYAGKIVLVKSVIEALASYIMSTALLRKSLLNQMMSII
jgi:hypothetical protein